MTAFNVAPLGRWLQVNCVPRMLMIKRCQNILLKKERTNICSSTFCRYWAGADPGFQVRGGVFKKIAPSGGKREKFGVFRVKNHDFTPKIHIFANFRGGGGGRARCAPPGSAPAGHSLFTYKSICIKVCIKTAFKYAQHLFTLTHICILQEKRLLLNERFSLFLTQVIRLS